MCESSCIFVDLPPERFKLLYGGGWGDVNGDDAQMFRRIDAVGEDAG